MVLTPRPAGASLLSSGSPLSAQGPRASSRKGKASPWTLPAQPGPWPWVPAGPREEAGEETEEESSPLKTPPLLLHCPVAGARGPHRAWPPRGQTARLQDASLCFSEPKLQTLGLVTGFLNTNLRMY